jgi:hypothetical protein
MKAKELAYKADHLYSPNDPSLGESGNYLIDFVARYQRGYFSPNDRVTVSRGCPEFAGDGVILAVTGGVAAKQLYAEALLRPRIKLGCVIYQPRPSGAHKEDG